MKLGNLQTFNVKKSLTIKAKAETKKNLPQKKTVKEEETSTQSVFKDVTEDRIITLSENSYIVVCANSIEGDDDVYVDIRMYRKTDKYNTPTKKGVRIHIEFLEDLINALQELDTELDNLGL